MSDPKRLREQWAPILRHKWLITLITLLMIGISLAISLTRETRYTATALVLVELDEEEELESRATEAQRVESVGVAERVIDETGSDSTATNLLSAVSARSLEDEGSVLAISFTATDPDRAAEIANAFADAYLAQRSEAAAETAAALSDTIEELVEETQAELEEVSQGIARSRRPANGFDCTAWCVADPARRGGTRGGASRRRRRGATPG